jgi:lipopolysaccharide biosynthesis glycosyltransferase
MLDSVGRESRVVVCCAADGSWALPLAVMLRSAEMHLRPERALVAHVVDGGLAEADRVRVRRSLGERTQIVWHSPDRSRLSNVPLWGHVSPSTYDRLVIGRILPSDLSRTLWLDCDLLILDDLSVLFDAEMDGACALASPDPLVKVVSSRFGVKEYRALGLAPETTYFNAGVMVVDLDAWRREQVEERAVDYLRRHGAQVFFHEQEALNVVLARRWRPLAQAWNWSAHPLHAPVEHLQGTTPSILHFTGARKPWICGGNGPWYARYVQYLDATDWRGERPMLGLAARCVLRYERSRLRRIFYPAENLAMWARRRMGARSFDPPPDSSARKDV